MIATAEMERESILHTQSILCRTARLQTTLKPRSGHVDLSHKGNERRQNDYIMRTIKKALTTIERER